MTNRRPKKIAEKELLTQPEREEAAECLKVMAHPMRLRIVELLQGAEYTVQDIARLCRLSHAQTCGHLRLLKAHGFLGSERRGRTVIYTIESRRLVSLIACIRRTCHPSVVS